MSFLLGDLIKWTHLFIEFDYLKKYNFTRPIRPAGISWEFFL